MKRKILVLTSTYPLSASDPQPGFVKYLCEELAKTNQVTVLTPQAPGAHSEERHGNLRVKRFHYFFPGWETLTYGSGILGNLKVNPWRGGLIPFYLLGLVIAIIRVLSKERWDVIHAHWIIPQGLAAVMAKFFTASTTPLVITSHGADLFALKGKLFDRLKAWTIRQAQRYTVVSSAMRDFSEKQLGIRREDIFVRSMGVDLQHRFKRNPKIAVQPDSVVFVGRLVPKKGVDYLIRAFRHVVDVFPNAQLTIVGDGLCRRELVRLTTSLNLMSHVNFLGSIPNSEIPLILNAHEVAVVPSIVASDGDQEGLGLVAVEAMGCGCAVIASDLPALRDVVQHEKNGLMVPEKDVEALARAILRLLGDKSLRQSLASAAREDVRKQFDWETVGKEYDALLLNSREVPGATQHGHE